MPPSSPQMSVRSWPIWSGAAAPFSKVARHILVAVTAVFVLLLGVTKPLHNWDMIAYVASAYELDGYGGRDLLDRTFRDVRSDVDSDTFRGLTEGKDSMERRYRETVHSDPRSLTQQIPFYSIRVVYIGLIRAVGRFGVSYSKASYMVSAACAALSVVVLARILTDAEVPVAVLPLIAVASGLGELARHSSADALAFFFALLGAMTLLEGSVLTFAFAAVLPLMRTDFILLSGLFLALEFFRGRRMLSIASMAVAALAYAAVNREAGNYGWLTLFNFSTGALTPYPAQLAPSANWKDYARPYVSAEYDLISNGQFLLYFIATYILFYRWRSGGVLNRAWWRPGSSERSANEERFYVLYVIPMAYAALHILLFPNFEPRYFVFSAALVFVWILSREKAWAAVAGSVPGLGGAG